MTNAAKEKAAQRANGKDNTKDEIVMIKNILGLIDGVDYSDDDNFKTLRYGRIIIASDYDVDGFHIKGLLINLIYTLWPELIEKGFLMEFISPIVMADGIEFFSEADF